MNPEILSKTEGAVKVCLSWFLAKNNLTHRVATHMSQRDPHKVEAEAIKFLKYIRPRLDNGSCPPDYIINMDQTPVYHAITASGKIVPTMVVFKGESSNDNSINQEIY